MQKNLSAHKPAERRLRCCYQRDCTALEGEGRLSHCLRATPTAQCRVCISLKRELECTWGPQRSRSVQEILGLWYCFHRQLCPWGHFICCGTSKWKHICAVCIYLWSFQEWDAWHSHQWLKSLHRSGGRFHFPPRLCAWWLGSQPIQRVTDCSSLCCPKGSSALKEQIPGDTRVLRDARVPLYT